MQEWFLLLDENGAVVARRRIVHHLKPAAEALTAEGKVCAVRGECSGLELKVTAETTQEDWRVFDDRILDEMDAWTDYFSCLDETPETCEGGNS